MGVVEGIVCVLEVTVELKETGPQVKMGGILDFKNTESGSALPTGPRLQG